MKSSFRVLLQKLNERIQAYSTIREVDTFADKLIKNHATNIRAAAVMYEVGKLLGKILNCGSNILYLDVIQDAFPVMMEDVDNTLVGFPINPSLFKQLEQCYDRDAIALIKVFTWNSALSIVGQLKDVNVALDTVELEPEISQVFPEPKISLLEHVTREELEEYIDVRIHNKKRALRLSYICEEIFKHRGLIEPILVKQEPVLPMKELLFTERLYGANLQALLYHTYKLP